MAISADGVKVSKNGWAIAEFTAEKGNEYLFKPNVVDGTVCIFAEKISSVETRSIDYTYSYNEDGTTASATATYLDKTHTYSYAYADGEDGTKSVTITDESGNAVCASDGSVNLDTGEGMEVLKFYFVVRNVPRCEGMKDGVMTAVVNRYVKTEVADGCQSTDKKVSFDGAIAILKASIPVYRGFTLPYVGQFREMSYAYYTVHNIDGATHVDFRCTDSMEDVQPLTVFNQNAYQCAYGTTPPMLVGLNKKKDYGTVNFVENYVKASDYSMSQFCYKAVGAALYTHECRFLWLYPSNNGGVNTSQVHGCLVGCAAYSGWLSVRSARCDNEANLSDPVFAGAFAVLLKQ